MTAEDRMSRAFLTTFLFISGVFLLGVGLLGWLLVEVIS